MIAELREEGADFILDLIDLFVTETPVRLAALEAALAQGDRSTAQRAVHTLKSTAAVFGAEAMAGLAAAAESAAQSGDLREVARLKPALHAATEQVKVALLAERETLRAAQLP